MGSTDFQPQWLMMCIVLHIKYNQAALYVVCAVSVPWHFLRIVIYEIESFFYKPFSLAALLWLLVMTPCSRSHTETCFTCSEMPSLSADTYICLSGQFKCTRKQKCIPLNLRCNGQDDCGDGEDETDCRKKLYDALYYHTLEYLDSDWSKGAS